MLKLRERRATRLLLVLLVLLGLAPVPNLAQSGETSEQSRLLEVRRQQLALSSARAELARILKLADEGLSPEVDLERARTVVASAQLDYQEAVLALLSLEPRISVQRAVKSQARDGRKWVDLTLVNLTPTFDDSQFELLSNFEGADPIPEQLRTRHLRDVFVSLRNAGEMDQNGRLVSRGTNIALPYETHLPELRYGDVETLRFQLLRDVNSVVVTVTYKTRFQEMDLQLEQAETENVVTVAAAQISQEADIGSQATFDLRLERSTIDVRSFQLKVLNMPQQIGFSFVDPRSEARLSQINFPAGVTRQDLRLQVFLPDRADEEIQIDRPLPFWVVATSNGQADLFRENRRYLLEEIEASRAGAASLEMIPRGVGRIEVSAPSLFSEIRAGETVETTLKVKNSGTRRLDNVQLTGTAPVGWRVEMSPGLLADLPIRQERDIALRIVPPIDVAVGDYELRIKTESYAYNRLVPAEDKLYRISVKSRSNLLGVGGVLGSLLLLLFGVIYGAMRLARR